MSDGQKVSALEEILNMSIVFVSIYIRRMRKDFIQSFFIFFYFYLNFLIVCDLDGDLLLSNIECQEKSKDESDQIWHLAPVIFIGYIYKTIERGVLFNLSSKKIKKV